MKKIDRALMLLVVAVIPVGATCETINAVSADGGWSVQAQILDEQGRMVPVALLQSNLPYRISVQVTPGANSGCPSAMKFDAAMPAHYHGMSTRATVTGRDCAFIVRGVYFQMRGAWELYFDLLRSATLSRVTVPVELKK